MLTDRAGATSSRRASGTAGTAHAVTVLACRFPKE